MSVTTSQRINQDKLEALLPTGASVSWTGPRLSETGEKVLTGIGVDDAALQTAVTAAAAAFVDRDSNRATIAAKAKQALDANDTFLAVATPTNAQILAQVRAVTRECSALIRLVLDEVETTGGTGP